MSTEDCWAIYRAMKQVMHAEDLRETLSKDTVNHEVFQALAYLKVDGLLLTDKAVAEIWTALKDAGLEIVRRPA